MRTKIKIPSEGSSRKASRLKRMMKLLPVVTGIVWDNTICDVKLRGKDGKDEE